jgi:S-adenosylmethionine hydrolase
MGIASDHAIITLTTDFGLQDPYAGQMKGSLLRGCPSATIIDITHAIPAWDVVTAAIVIRNSYAFFPSGSIHLVVVDPGVGGQRSILVAEGDSHFFIAPDNGILSQLVADHKIETIHRVDDPVFFSASVTPTFHGRDIMAPVAAALANGRDLHDFGTAVPLQTIQLIIVPSVVSESNSLHGQVQHIDNFGNIRTTIRVGHGLLETASFQFLEICGQRIATFARTYSDVAPGALLVLIDSSGYLEVAANQARAAEILDCVLGDRISVHIVYAE